jgi:predicted dehydrogenase
MSITVGVIGCGYWGPNLIRNFAENEAASLRWVCDRDARRLEKISRRYPAACASTDHTELIADPQLDAVVISTPVATHYAFARAALLAGKHVLVEKPFTASAREGEELIALASARGLTLMVDHTFLYTGAVRRIKELVASGEIGDLLYFDSVRINLGLFQHDVNVLWDLAPHDLSIMDHVLQQNPEAVVATGGKHFNDLADMAFITVYFPGNLVAHVNVNWLSPVKVRTTLIGGKDKMLVWNDLEPDEKIKVYDKGINITPGRPEDVYKMLVSYRSGDMWAPRLDNTEALQTEALHFIDCIENNKQPETDGPAGLRLVNMIEAAETSLSDRGRLVEIQW